MAKKKICVIIDALIPDKNFKTFKPVKIMLDIDKDCIFAELP